MQILIVDLGSQYTLVIGRTLRELGVRSIILPPKNVPDWLKTNKPNGIILSGGNYSVYQEGAPDVPEEVLSAGVPVLGICYGMQWLAKVLGGIVTSNQENKEYGETEITFTGVGEDCLLFRGLLKKSIVWASHGDSVTLVPQGFGVAAVSGETIAAMVNDEQGIWGVQFHPEVVQSKDGKVMLCNFLFDLCGCQKDWLPQNIVGAIQEEAVATLAGRKAIIGFSGGVDSTTLATILSSVLGENLRAVCIDTGALRKGELDEIRKNARHAGVNLRVVKAAGRFLEAVRTSTHSEVKRKSFSKVYGKILQEEARKFGGNFKSVVLIQGSLATDFIESGGTGKAKRIKKHHNIGNKLRVAQVHPLRNLFKYEVRELAHQLGLPSSITSRQPFPGPGLFVRIVGVPVNRENLAIVKWADDLVASFLKLYGLYHQISQLVVSLVGLRTVGIKGDARVYGFSIVVRAVQTADFMTTVGFQIPAEVRRQITSCVTKHPKIVRVWFDETHKPPATTELE